MSHVTCLIFFRCTCLCFFNDPRSDLTNLIPWWHDCNRFYNFSEKTQDPEGRFQNMHPLIITTKSNVWMVHLARVYVIISILSNWESTSPNTAMLREAKKVELLHQNWFLKINLYNVQYSNEQLRINHSKSICCTKIHSLKIHVNLSRRLAKWNPNRKSFLRSLCTNSTECPSSFLVQRSWFQTLFFGVSQNAFDGTACEKNNNWGILHSASAAFRLMKCNVYHVYFMTTSWTHGTKQT